MKLVHEALLPFGLEPEAERTLHAVVVPGTADERPVLLVPDSSAHDAAPRFLPLCEVEGGRLLIWVDGFLRHNFGLTGLRFDARARRPVSSALAAPLAVFSALARSVAALFET